MKYRFMFLLAIIGLFCLILGLYFMDIYKSGDIRYIFSILFGVGCTVFGVNIGHIIELSVMKKESDDIEKVRIEQQDERNIYINNMAKSKAFNLMGYVFMTVTLIFCFNNVNYKVLFTLIGALFFVYIVYFIYYLNLNNKF